MKGKFIRKSKQVLSMILTIAFMFTSILTAGITVSADSESGEILKAFEDPNYKDKPMARMWFPDASAGIDDNDTIAKQIQELVDGGFGGVEVTMLANGSDMTNEEAKYVGWGTEAWRKLLKKVLEVANAVDGGFTVDITITPHWPTVISSIDPNDQAASQEISYATRKMVTDDVYSGDVELPLPEIKTEDAASSVAAAEFIFTDTLVSSQLVKVDSVDGDGNITYDFDSVIDLTDNTSEIEDLGYAAGVPDSVTAEVYGWDYQDILDTWGDEPADDADFSQSFNEKIDTEGNRKRMADWQYFYQSDISGVDELKDYTSSSGNDIQAGDYVLVGIYRRGTGQIMSDAPFGGTSILMYGRTYTTNYFCNDGVNAITSYWENNILDDELRSLLEENGSSIFEDSIEASKTTSFWSYNFVDELKNKSYKYTSELPLVVALGASSFNDSTLAGRIETDYNNLLGNLFETEHLEPIKDWARTFNYSYRAQAYGIEGVDESSTAAIVDIPEGDNAAKGDGLRLLAGSANMEDKAYLSMEAVTGFGNLKINWADVLTEINQNYSDGVNHVILHGTPYNKAWNGYISDWPGWLAFGNNFCGSYTYRQVYWDDVNSLSGYMARNQAVMANGTAKIDLAVLGSNASGNTFQTLLDNGYSYNMMSEPVIKSGNANVSNGMLYKDGPGYKALILDGISTLSVDAAVKLLVFADAGLPIILYNTDPTTISGTDTDSNNDEDMARLFDKLEAKSNVYTVETKDEILTTLQSLDIKPDASYEQSALEATRYSDESDGSEYYYLFNNPYPSNTGMINPGQNESYKNGDDINTDVTLKGNGTPYLLDAWTGDVTPIVDYTVNDDGTITTSVSLSGGQSKIIAIINNDEDIPYATEKSGGEVVYEDGNIALRSNEAGTYSVKLSDGTEKSITVDSALEELDLSDASWDLELQSFGPDESSDNIEDAIVPELTADYVIYKDPSSTVRTTVNFEGISLGSWSDLPATEDQLNELGVDSMENVSGIGYYTTTFDLPDGWSDTTGAILDFGYSQDEVTEITVNGNTISNVDIIADKTNIGKYLITGENTITIKLCSALFNRALVESMVYGLGGIQLSGTTPTDTGLKTVTLTPHTQIVITSVSDDQSDFTVSTTYTVGSTENASVLVANNLLDANSVITNNGTESENVLLIVALYDSDGTMVNVSYLSKVVEAKASENFHAGFKLPADITGYTAKAFVWDGDSIASSSMTPLSNVTEITD